MDTKEYISAVKEAKRERESKDSYERYLEMTVTDLFQVPLKRMKELTALIKTGKENMTLEEVQELQHYMKLGKLKKQELMKGYNNDK